MHIGVPETEARALRKDSMDKETEGHKRANTASAFEKQRLKKHKERRTRGRAVQMSIFKFRLISFFFAAVPMLTSC